MRNRDHLPYVPADRLMSAKVEGAGCGTRERELPFDSCDEAYARFHYEPGALMGRPMTPREVDSVLLAVAERR